MAYPLGYNYKLICNSESLCGSTLRTAASVYKGGNCICIFVSYTPNIPHGPHCPHCLPCFRRQQRHRYVCYSDCHSDSSCNIYFQVLGLSVRSLVVKMS